MGRMATVRPAGRDDPDTAGPAGVLAVARPRRPYLVDCGVALLFLAVAVWLGHGLWPDPAIRQLLLNPADQVLIEWFLAVDTSVLLGEHGLVTDRLNAPDGVNLMANASSPLLGFLLAPVTLTLGAPVSFAVLTIGNLAGTATGWYLLFTRTLGASRTAAAAGGALCGFAPAMVSHSNAHWHMTAQWLVPAIVWSVVRLARAAGAPDHRRVVTSALWLAGLVVAQYFLGAEVLYLTALTLVLVTVGYAAGRRDWARRTLPGFAAGLAIAAGTATILLAYPLWVQLAGPGSVPDGPFSPHYFSADLASWAAHSPLTVAGTGQAAGLATGPAEYNTFLGWPLLLVAAGCGIWLRRHPLALAAAIAALVMGMLSLGPELVVDRVRTGIPLPYTALVDFPVIDGALPQRYAVAVVPLIATLLVLALDRAHRQPARLPTGLARWTAGLARWTTGLARWTTGLARWPPGLAHWTGGLARWPPGLARWTAPAAVGLALLPLAPTPLPTQSRPPVPAFFSQGHWRGCVEPDGVLVPVPLPTPRAPEPMRWAASANARFAVPEGFFIGPYRSGGRASIGTAPRPTSRLLAQVAATGQVRPVGAGHRAQAARDLAYWRAQCVVLDPDQRYEGALHRVLVELLGPGELIAGAWAWRV